MQLYFPPVLRQALPLVLRLASRINDTKPPALR